MKKLAPPSPVELRFRRILALLGFLMVVFGQFWVFAEPATLDALPPSTLILSGIGLAFFFASFFIRLRPSFQSRIENFRISHKVIWVLAAVFFSCLAAFAMLLFMKYDKNTYIPVLTAWFGAGAFYVFAFRGAIPSWKGIWSWVKAHRSELVIVGGITLVAAGLRLITLGVYPRVIDGDEGLLGLYAQTTNVGALANPFALWENFGALYLQGVNLAIRLFGATPLALRIFPAISGILAVPALYLFARRVAGKKVATLSAFLLAISHTHINFSRIGSVGYIHGTWLVPLELFLLLTGLEKKKTWMTAAAGVLLAIHFCVYLTSQVIIALVLVFMLLLLIFKKRWFLQCYRQAAAFLPGWYIPIRMAVRDHGKHREKCFRGNRWQDKPCFPFAHLLSGAGFLWFQHSHAYPVRVSFLPHRRCHRTYQDPQNRDAITERILLVVDGGDRGVRDPAFGRFLPHAGSAACGNAVCRARHQRTDGRKKYFGH